MKLLTLAVLGMLLMVKRGEQKMTQWLMRLAVNRQ